VKSGTARQLKRTLGDWSTSNPYFRSVHEFMGCVHACVDVLCILEKWKEKMMCGPWA